MITVNAGAVDAIEPGEATVVPARAAGHSDDVAVFRTEDDEIFALDDTCSHEEASLGDGWLEGDQVECPLHSACFSLRTGEALCMPATRPVANHRVEVVDGEILVHIGE